MRRHVVLAIETGDDGDWADSERMLEEVRRVLEGLPVSVIVPSHGKTIMNPRVEFVGWTPEDLKRAGA